MLCLIGLCFDATWSKTAGQTIIVNAIGVKSVCSLFIYVYRILELNDVNSFTLLQIIKER